MVVVKRLGHADQVRGGSEDDKDVEDLVGAAPDVELARVLAFRPANLLLDETTVSTKRAHPALLRVRRIILLTAYKKAPKMYSPPWRMTQPRPMRAFSSAKL